MDKEAIVYKFQANPLFIGRAQSLISSFSLGTNHNIRFLVDRLGQSLAYDGVVFDSQSSVFVFALPRFSSFSSKRAEHFPCLPGLCHSQLPVATSIFRQAR